MARDITFGIGEDPVVVAGASNGAAVDAKNLGAFSAQNPGVFADDPESQCHVLPSPNHPFADWAAQPALTGSWSGRRPESGRTQFRQCPYNARNNISALALTRWQPVTFSK